MKNKALLITSGTFLVLSLATGSLFATTKGRNKVSLVLADEPIHGNLTIDTNYFWGEGAESYKLAACFIDGTPEGEYWTSLVSVEAPNRFASVYFELPIDLEPTHVVLYRYSSDVDESAWELNKAEGKIGETSSIAYDANINNIVLTSDIYGLYRVPTECRQVWLPDEETHESQDVSFIDVALNSAHDAEYSVTVMLEEKDVFKLEPPMFENTYEDKITLADSINPGDLEYYQDEVSPDMYKGFDVNVAGTYTFTFDYYANHLVITKESPEPVDPVDPSGGEDTPSEKEDEPFTPKDFSVKDIFKVILNAFKDAWKDLMKHIKGWLKRS